MAANTTPIFILTPNTGIGLVQTSAFNTYDGTTLGASQLVWTAGANGGILQRVRAQPHGSNVATLVRLFLNNGSAIGTAANNALIGEFGFPATTASAVLPIPPIDYALNIPVPGGYILYACIATAVAAGVKVIAYGGNY